ncbi:MAG: hypothetical protein PF447_06105, partial [Spirochaetaceae bacterium]|nr:hypothetical protein [Spirochaetaceae bacterium]
GNSLTWEGEFKTTWERDMDTNQSGFTEDVALELGWDILDFTTHTSDTNVDGYYGVMTASGGNLRFYTEYNTVADSIVGDNDAAFGDTANLSTKFTWEQIWGRVNFGDIYLLVGAAETQFTRINGWNYARQQDSLRADWAHLGARTQKGYLLNTDPWVTNGSADLVATAPNSAGLGVGYVGGLYEALFTVSAPSVEANDNDEYNFGLDAVASPIAGLTVNFSSVYQGVQLATEDADNTVGDNLTLAFGTGYFMEINSDMTLEPFVGYDTVIPMGQAASGGSDIDRYLAHEASVGVTLNWPGAAGWGYDPLLDWSAEIDESNIYSGITAAANVYLAPTDGAEPQINAQVSSHEVTTGGLVPNLGWTFIVEVKDITNAREYPDDVANEWAYGIYADYSIDSIITPYIGNEYKVTASTTEPDIMRLNVGVDFTMIPNTTFKVDYNNDQFIVEDQDGDNGNIAISIAVTF